MMTGMDERSKVVSDELRLLRDARAALEQGSVRPSPSEAGVVRELERLRELLVEGADAKDRAALLDQWDRQSALLQQLRESRQAPPIDPDSPYFGHLRLRESTGEWEVCIGKGTFIERGVRIIDWRNAPVSRIFYGYRQGEEFEEEMAGRIRSGSVVTRRTVTIRGGKLERIDAPEGIFLADPAAPEGWRHSDAEPLRLAGGEGSALRIYASGEGAGRRLGSDPHGIHERRDKHLPEIAGLIDPAQFELITRPHSGLVVIRGSAGSGKTTVALHRIAYLAYEDPTIDSAQTLVVVFSKGLRNYVSHVLPALGIENVQIRTFQNWAAEQRRRLFPMLPRETRESAPTVVQRLKAHPALLAALAEQVERTPGAATPRQVIDDWASALSQHPLLEDAFARAAPSAFSGDELRQAADWNRRRYEELTAWMNGDKTVQAELDPEDDALLLRSWQLRIGSIPAPDGQLLRYRHIAVDEVQDFSPLEVRVLLECLDPQRSMTLAGDTQQHILEQAGFTSWNDFFRHLSVPATEVNTLRVNYRSTQQIMDFALALLGELREDEAATLSARSGPPVEIFRFTAHGACVAFLADALRDLAAKEPLASVALLTPNSELSRLYYDGLERSELPKLQLVTDQDFSFAPGVEVTEIDQVKGLEFDYVVLIEASATHFPDTPHARRLLHVGATRAIHQLWLTSVATPSRLLRAAG